MVHTVAGFFSGTGGIELGLQQAGFHTLYSNDFDKYVADIYEANFPDHTYQVEDITKVDFNDVPDTDTIVGGFPCQAFSIAGNRQGFDDEKGRGNLFFRILEAIQEKRPDTVLLENVKNLVTHDHGNTFQMITSLLEEEGYHLKWQVLNAKDYGNIPQGRERIYIVGFRDKTAADKFTFPEPTPLTTKITDVIDFDNKVADKYYYTAEKNPNMWPIISEDINHEGTIYQWRRKYVRANKSGVCPTLTANMGTGGVNVPLILTKHGIRKLTPRECFNLQGYPETYILPEHLSDSRLYKAAGNAVVVPVIKRIAEQMIKALDS